MATAEENHIRWMLAPETDEPPIPFSEFGIERTQACVAAVFTLGIEKALGENPPESDRIQDFIETARSRYANAEALPPVKSEAVIRLAYEDDSMIDGLSPDEIQRIQQLLGYASVQFLGLTGAAYDEFVREAAEMVIEYVNE
ncbi:hypothetical protein [Kineosporia sp. NBRC 101731]|uniref:hypothetical protein n=1 Tax=Kineosporia sp. NBRC 101731 TaxID=3032199 RepID=UPI0024A16F06|nr:hypothetical protein [Kineosporia sp. NBRC 101731]GLY29857.1 hypothetical protein Kisp02_32220 [Kineosporia sp. NBRC 101731]